MLICVISEGIGINEKSVTIQPHTSPTVAVMGPGCQFILTMEKDSNQVVHCDQMVGERYHVFLTLHNSRQESSPTWHLSNG